MGCRLLFAVEGSGRVSGQADRQAFVQLMVDQGVLRFGEFELKSGRRSPYFFNLGAISDGPALQALGEYYAGAIAAAGLECDVLFGPAYKGIPIAVAASVAAARRGINLAVAFDRKEAKDHGEGGVLVGAELSGRRVVLVDDVVTDGATKQEGAQLIAASGGELVGVVVGLDRQETIGDGETAVARLQSRLGVPVYSVLTLEDVVSWLDGLVAAGELGPALAKSVKAYRNRFCVLGG